MNKQPETQSVSVEELKRQYDEMWNAGEFEFNHHFGDDLGRKPINPQRIWNVFIKPMLHTHSLATEEVLIREIRQAIESGDGDSTWWYVDQVDAIATKRGITLSDSNLE